NLGQAQVEGAPDSVYMLVDRLSIEALKIILDRPADDLPRVQLAHVTTASLPALRAYLEGEVLYRKADWPAAIDAYQRAVAADSTFALAWLRLSESISWLPAGDRPEGDVDEPAARAARHVDRLAEREAVLVRAYQHFIIAGSMTMLEPLKSATRRYPDDPELAYLLGEHYAHFGDQLLVDPAETERALDRAIQLDPTFAPYYQHPIEYAFYRGDSARALELLGKFESLAGGTFEVRRYRLGAALAWGTPAERSKAFSALDTLREGGASPSFLLVQPRFLEALLASADAALRGENTLAFVFANLTAGRLEAVDEALRAGQGIPGPGFYTAVLYFKDMYGLPVNPDSLRALATADTTFPNMYYTGVLAAQEGRREEVRAWQAQARAFAQTMLEAGDTLGANQVLGFGRTIEGFSLLQQGNREAALAALLAGQRAATGWGPVAGINAIVRWQIAGVLVDLGREEEAVPWYRSFRNDPYAALELGKVYETLGRRGEAKEQYETALAFWREADPALAPKVAEARQRLAGLGFQPRG
ncbi:MAG TPA: hypothetical protein VEY33_01670, partial [Gemmatimonadota bacterium]|nr:hypothetical protein [Gemmatimonadota bacterium]